MTDEPTDRDLAARVVSNGDEEAFRTLYRRHALPSLRFAAEDQEWRASGERT